LYGLRQIGGDLPLGPHKTDLRVLAAMLFVTSLMFVSVPRTGLGPGVQNTQRYLDVSGFSDAVNLGDFARSLDATVVMRVEPDVDGAWLPKAKYWLMRHYWRGASLDHFNGHGWEKMQEVPAAPLPAMMRYRGDKSGKIAVALYREAFEHSYIFLPDNLVGLDALPQAARWFFQGSLKFEQTPQTRIRIPMWLGGTGTEWAIASQPLPLHSQAPASTVIASWAQGLTKGAREPKAQMRALVKEMRGWEYDLNAEIDPYRPIEHFIGQKQGHCELYASALTLAARSLGIPARVVNGYRGGDWNEVGGFLVIRKSHAHSWVEAWVDGIWRRYDATPNVLWDITASEPSAWENNWEAIKLAWYRYVLDFTDEDRDFLWQSLLALMREPVILLLLLPLLVFAALGWRRFIPTLTRPGGGNLWPVVDKWLARHGIIRTTGVPLSRLHVPENVNESQWRSFVRDWERQAYAGKPWNRWTLRRQLRALL
ncbi:MAG: transglutaminaseTgpA domain-containing protein, partial [Mariprofundaceae bacterium]